jgi:hypothetical protein
VACRDDRVLHALLERRCLRCGQLFTCCGRCQPGRLYCSEGCSRAARIESARAARDTYNARDTAEGREEHQREEAERRARRAKERALLAGFGAGQPAAADGPDFIAPVANAWGGSGTGFGTAPGCQPGSLPAHAVAPMAWPNRDGSLPGNAGHLPTAPTPVAQHDSGFGPVAERVGDHRCPDPADDLQVVSSTDFPADQEARHDTPGVSREHGSAEAAKSPAVQEEVAWVLVVDPQRLRAAQQRLGAQECCLFCGRGGRIQHVVTWDQWRRNSRLRRGLAP